MAELTLVGDSSWTSPWVFHAFVALEEKQLPYELERVALPVAGERRAAMLERSPLATVPMLRHRDLAITESLAISEYLAETFPMPAHPRLFPANLGERARARQLMSWLRTRDLAQGAAAELVRVASLLLSGGREHLFESWCIADADLARALKGVPADAVPAPLATYAEAQWQRASVRAYLAR